MQLVSPSSIHACVPFVIPDRPGTDGCWLGGRPPEGMAPSRSDGSLRYFATVPLATDSATFVSLFVSDLEALMQARGSWNHDDLVQAVTHPLRPRSRRASPANSILSERSIQLLAPSDDWIGGANGERVVKGWSVYYSERGERRNERLFEREEKACRYSLALLGADPSTKG